MSSLIYGWRRKAETHMATGVIIFLRASPAAAQEADAYRTFSLVVIRRRRRTKTMTPTLKHTRNLQAFLLLSSTTHLSYSADHQCDTGGGDFCSTKYALTTE